MSALNYDSKMPGKDSGVWPVTEPSPAEALEAFINAGNFPCLMAKSALHSGHLECLTVKHMACPANDGDILGFLYRFADLYKQQDSGYHSAAVIFEQPQELQEAQFDQLLWQRLQALADLDALRYSYDQRVSADPSDENFSFSLKQEAFYVIGLHPRSSRKARQFSYPALIFNPHAQFESLRVENKYDRIKELIRNRDVHYSGSVNPMLADFGKASETLQYSGRAYDQDWKCPFHSKHQTNDNNSTA